MNGSWLIMASPGTTSGSKMHLAKVRPIVAGELAGDGQDSGLRGLHRRFEVIAGAQAQVD